MRTIAILPMKAFAAAKRRLAPELPGAERAELAAAMLDDVAAALEQAGRLDAIAVVTADADVRSALADRPIELVEDRARSGQSAAALAGVEHALARGHDRALLVPGDTPLLRPEAVDAMLDRAERDPGELLIVPDRHATGTNALLIAPPHRFEPAFGPGSLARHRARAAAAGLRHRVEVVDGLDLDVDAPEDLAELRRRLTAAPEAAPRTRAVLAALGADARRAAIAPAAGAVTGH